MRWVGELGKGGDRYQIQNKILEIENKENFLIKTFMTLWKIETKEKLEKIKKFPKAKILF
jgi:hypothetical protein